MKRGRRPKFTADALLPFAQRGLTIAQAATEMGLSYSAVHGPAIRLGLGDQFRANHKAHYSKPKPKGPNSYELNRASRRAQVLELALRGASTPEVAKAIGVTRAAADLFIRRDEALLALIRVNRRARQTYGKRYRPELTDAQRLAKWKRDFWSRVDVRGEDECWEWKMSRITGGYGHINIGHVSKGLLQWPSTNAYAHRLAFYFHNGTIDHSLSCDHLCHNRACCNPAHIRQVTVSENCRRKWFHVVDERPASLPPLKPGQRVIKGKVREVAAA